ncbi:hypothetical protein [Paraburkholderia aromaticivorans]|uniref:hypothetical protein n=1 Tax=Paraburkholderia aromaticivorans TaxID=2026199 RepID=UPI001455ED8C|nr:hypothetical protein [Paraburkholderia aromaticivorans]
MGVSGARADSTDSFDIDPGQKKLRERGGKSIAAWRFAETPGTAINSKSTTMRKPSLFAIDPLRPTPLLDREFMKITPRVAAHPATTGSRRIDEPPELRI